jgi:hypothetical protein
MNPITLFRSLLCVAHTPYGRFQAKDLLILVSLPPSPSSRVRGPDRSSSACSRYPSARQSPRWLSGRSGGVSGRLPRPCHQRPREGGGHPLCPKSSNSPRGGHASSRSATPADRLADHAAVDHPKVCARPSKAPPYPHRPPGCRSQQRAQGRRCTTGRRSSRATPFWAPDRDSLHGRSHLLQEAKDACLDMVHQRDSVRTSGVA